MATRAAECVVRQQQRRELRSRHWLEGKKADGEAKPASSARRAPPRGAAAKTAAKKPAAKPKPAKAKAAE